MSYAEVVDHPLFAPPFRWRMAVRTLPPADWLQPDDARDDDLRLKAELLARPDQDALRWEPGSEAAAAAVLELVAADLDARGLELASAGVHPIDTVGRSVQEDVCLMEHDGQAWRLTAGSVCFPTRWSLADKIGGSLATIHEPVPGYADELGSRVDRFFDRMTPGSIAYRINWSLVGDPARRLPAAERQAPTRIPEDPATGLHVRIERQTLRRLEPHAAIVFGIRVHGWPLGTVLGDLPAATFAAEIRSAPAAVARYKNLEGLRDELARWLERGGEGA